MYVKKSEERSVCGFFCLCVIVCGRVRGSSVKHCLSARASKNTHKTHTQGKENEKRKGGSRELGCVVVLPKPGEAKKKEEGRQAHADLLTQKRRKEKRKQGRTEKKRGKLPVVFLG